MLDQILSGLQFYSQAKTVNRIHSAKAKDFVSHVLDADKTFYSFHPIEVRRENLQRDRSSIEIQDFGAGSRTLGKKSRLISDIAKTSLSTPKQCQSLFKCVEHYKPKSIIELGSSLGISSAYIASGNKAAKFTTLEGDPRVATYAKETLLGLKLTNAELVVGQFKDQLPSVLEDHGEVDMAFIDGHHTYDATIEYAKLFLPYLNKQSILVFDDIYWSEGMRKAWEEIKRIPEVTLTIDTYFQGYVFFDQAITNPEHYSYIDKKYKPW